MILKRSTAEERIRRLAMGRAEKARNAIFEPNETDKGGNADVTLAFLAEHDSTLLERLVDQSSSDKDYLRSWKRLLNYEMLSPEAGSVKEESLSPERILFYLNRTRRALIIVPLAHTLVQQLEPSSNEYNIIAGVSRIHRAASSILDGKDYSKEETSAVTLICILRHMATGTSNVPPATSYKQIEQDAAYVIDNHDLVYSNLETLFERHAYTADFMESLVSIETRPLMEGQL